MQRLRTEMRCDDDDDDDDYYYYYYYYVVIVVDVQINITNYIITIDQSFVIGVYLTQKIFMNALSIAKLEVLI